MANKLEKEANNVMLSEGNIYLIDQMGHPINGSQRLPTFKSRNYLNGWGNNVKKKYTPNISQALNRKKGQVVADKFDDNFKSSKVHKIKLNKKLTKETYIPQCDSIFAQGREDPNIRSEPSNYNVIGNEKPTSIATTSFKNISNSKKYSSSYSESLYLQSIYLSKPYSQNVSDSSMHISQNDDLNQMIEPSCNLLRSMDVRNKPITLPPLNTNRHQGFSATKSVKNHSSSIKRSFRHTLKIESDYEEEIVQPTQVRTKRKKMRFKNPVLALLRREHLIGKIPNIKKELVFDIENKEKVIQENDRTLITSFSSSNYDSSDQNFLNEQNNCNVQESPHFYHFKIPAGILTKPFLNNSNSKLVGSSHNNISSTVYLHKVGIISVSSTGKLRFSFNIDDNLVSHLQSKPIKNRAIHNQSKCLPLLYEMKAGRSSQHLQMIIAATHEFCIDCSHENNSKPFKPQDTTSNHHQINSLEYLSGPPKSTTITHLGSIKDTFVLRLLSALPPAYYIKKLIMWPKTLSSLGLNKFLRSQDPKARPAQCWPVGPGRNLERAVSDLEKN